MSYFTNLLVFKIIARKLVITGIFFLPAYLFAQQIDYKGFPQWSLQKQDSTEYALYTPANLEPGKKYPIVLFMHGCCGKDYHASLRNAVDPPVRMWHQFGANKQLTPTFIIAPATSTGWKQHFKNLKVVMDDLVANHTGDPQRIYVTGFSMGGEGTFRIIQEYPGYFAAALPMGMSFSGDSLKIKDIPLWINQGETDWYARKLRKQVAAIRSLNGLATDTGSTWITGVNPRYSNFKGVGHGVQWVAASTQDLTQWAYSKINDGNKYPSVFFKPVINPVIAKAGQKQVLDIEATDSDGTIDRVDVYVNKIFFSSLQKRPYSITLSPVEGDNLIEATAFDNKGKSATAIVIVKVNRPAKFVTTSLTSAFAGEWYHTRLEAIGNGRLIFSADENNKLPTGFKLYPDGTVKGVAVDEGVYKIKITVADEDNETNAMAYTIKVERKNPGTVLVSDMMTADGKQYALSKMAIGEAPNFNSSDSILTTDTDEINFSNIDKYGGLTYIQTDNNDAKKTTANFLSFHTDEDVTVYVAYEVLDNKFTSTIPAWLSTFKKEEGQIVAQYRYFNVYSKSFKKGKIVLPGADAKTNKVSTNYFVMLKR